MMDKAIWWLRRDLRLRDNQALSAALGASRQVVPVFVIDPVLIESPNASDKRLAFLWDGLHKLDEDLRARGSYLVVRRGRPAEVLPKLADEIGVTAVFAEADFSPYARQRDELVAEGLRLNLVGGSGVSHPEAVLKADGSPYTVYTPFMRTWKGIHKPTTGQLLSIPERVSTPKSILGEPIPDQPKLSASTPFQSGESEAQHRLFNFLEKSPSSDGPAPVYRYADTRNRMDLGGTSQLSPYLRFGMLSPRAAVASAYAAIETAYDPESRKGAETWLNELIWREFYISILYHFPFVSRTSFRSDLRKINWRHDPEEFDAWCQGRTGYPVVDAAMRQLAQTGWMHNRARMIVASFLVKDLLIDWRWGERWFMQNLVDGDPAANNGGWQWTAGTGTDAAPYFRIFNPVLQGRKFDPQGDFIRQYIPELQGVGAQNIHTPWEMPQDLQRQTDCIIGRDYPQPIVDHSFARERTLEAYKVAKES